MNRENLKSFNINSIVAVKLSESGKIKKGKQLKNLFLYKLQIKQELPL